MWLAGLLMVLSSLFTACTKEEGVNLDNLNTPQGNELCMVSFTRAGIPLMTTAATTVTEDYSPIGVFLVENGAATQSDRFIYKSNESLWRSKLEVTSNHNYAIYGYAPADAVTAAISDESLTGATLTFTNLPAVSSQDICFVAGVQQVETTADEKDIHLGQFSFTGKAQDQNFANLLLDHVYAGLCIQATIGTEYAQLRSIKIRKLELQTTTASATATIVLAANDTETSPVQSATYSSLLGTEEHSAIFFESTEGVELDATTLTEATCCFVPTLGSELTLITTYDVYDRYGNKISERTATNKLPNLNAARGQRVNLALTIEPTYLGVLSDKDLDDPTVKVSE